MKDEFTIVQDLVAPGDPGSHYHLLDWQTGEMITTLWSHYLRVSRDGRDYGDVVPAPRKVTTILERESYPGERLTRGIRVSGRSRRTITFEAAIWRTEDQQPIVRTEIVTVAADRSTGQAVEIPDDIWSGIQTLEGREIPITSRAVQQNP